MIALAGITPWHWAWFIAAVVVFLALDLGVLHPQAHVVQFKEALFWTAIWFVLAMLFAFLLVPEAGRVEFVTGYILELSLSMDNVFVIALIFAYFRVGGEYQHRVLFWGILGALLMRGVMIGIGAALVHRFAWILYVFGAFLLFTGVKMLCARNDGVEPEKNPVVRLARRFFPVAPHFDGQKFITLHAGKKALTPLALVLVVVETTDLIFAVDSLPAIFAVTREAFIVFTSNVFAILGLRSLYFVLAGALRYFRFLKFGLSFVLVFIGSKMLLLPFQIKISTLVSLAVVTGIILLSIIASVALALRERPEPPPGKN